MRFELMMLLSWPPNAFPDYATRPDARCVLNVLLKTTSSPSPLYDVIPSRSAPNEDMDVHGRRVHNYLEITNTK